MVAVIVYRGRFAAESAACDGYAGETLAFPVRVE